MFHHLFAALLLTVLILCPIAVYSQTAGTGTISGTISDSSHAVVPDATIEIRSTDTGFTRTITTNSDGLYSAPFLQPGHYELLVTRAGFASISQKNLTLTVGGTINLDLTLPVQSSQTTVEVTAAPVVDENKTEASQTISQAIISSVPVNGRRWDNFILLTPNVKEDGNSGLISYRGISGLYNSNQVDGANNNQAFFSEARGRSIGAPYVYSQDSIQEFQSQTATYSAEFGQAVGGQINAITKSGTNNLHGDLFYYLRYPALNALDSLGKRQGIFTQPVKQQQQFGGSVGGPIIKEKLFYFFTYDGFRKVNPVLYTSSTPAAGLTCPVATANDPVAPTASQCAAAKSYLSSLVSSYPRNIRQDILFPKIDWQVNQKNLLSVNFLGQNFDEPNGYNTSPTANNSSVTTNGPVSLHERFAVAKLITTISDRSINEFRFQWGRDLETAGSNAPGPSVSISQITTYGEPNALPRPAFPDEHRIQLTDVFSHTAGRHTFKYGGDVNLIHEKIVNLFQGGGIYSYSRDSTAQANFNDWLYDVYGLNGGRHYFSFTQVRDTVHSAKNGGLDDMWNKNLDVFFEDSWKITPKFLINLGVRYDIQLVPQPPKPNTTSDLAILNTSTINTDTNNIAPRIGFAWQPYAGTVVRGGYGIFYGLTSNSTWYATRAENGVFQQQYTSSVSGKAPNYTYAPTAPQNLNVYFTPPGPPLAPPFEGALTPQVVDLNPPAASQAFRGVDPHFVNPYSHAMNLTLEQELPGRFSLSIGYVGSRANRLPLFIDANVAPATQTRTYAVLDTTGKVTQNITLPYYTQRITSASGIMLTGYSVLNSWYNSAAVTIRRPFDHGFELLLNHTWSKAQDNGQVSGTNGTFNGTDTPLDPFNTKAESARSDLDVRNRFTGTLVYTPQLQFIQNRQLKYAANGWSISGAFTSSVGLPLTAFLNNSPTGIGNFVNGGGLTGAEVSLFASSTPGRAPQVGRNSFAAPGLRNLDMRVARTFPITEKIGFQVLGEAFNVLNRQNTLSVNSTGYKWNAAGSSVPLGISTPNATCPASVNGCISPYFVSKSDKLNLGQPTSTNSLLYGARQLQFSAKLIF